MHCKSLWMKASAKCINVNGLISVASLALTCTFAVIASLKHYLQSLFLWFEETETFKNNAFFPGLSALVDHHTLIFDSLDSLSALVSIVFLIIQMAACMITLMRLFAINPMVSSGGPEGKFLLMVSLWVRSQRKENIWKEKSTNTSGKEPENYVVLLQNRDTIQKGGIDGVWWKRRSSLTEEACVQYVMSVINYWLLLTGNGWNMLVW